MNTIHYLTSRVASGENPFRTLNLMHMDESDLVPTDPAEKSGRRGFFRRLGQEVVKAPVTHALVQQAASQLVQQAIAPRPPELARVINTHSDIDTLKKQMSSHGFEHIRTGEYSHAFSKQDDFGNEHTFHIHKPDSTFRHEQPTYRINGELQRSANNKAFKFEVPKSTEPVVASGTPPPRHVDFGPEGHFDQSTHDRILNTGFKDHYEVERESGRPGMYNSGGDLGRGDIHHYARYNHSENPEHPEETGHTVSLNPSTGDWSVSKFGASSSYDNAFGLGHGSLVRHLDMLNHNTSPVQSGSLIRRASFRVPKKNG